MEKKFGVAVIGYGGMGSWHVKKLLSLADEGVEMRGVYDINPARNQAAEEIGVHAYASREELLSDPAIDLVTVAIPNDVHHEVCVDAMRHGKHVVCEKPVTLSSESLQEMIDESKRNHVIFTVHQNRRWDEDFLIMKKIYDEGTLGPVFNIESRVHGSRGIPGRLAQHQGTRRRHGAGLGHSFVGPDYADDPETAVARLCQFDLCNQ